MNMKFPNKVAHIFQDLRRLRRFTTIPCLRKISGSSFLHKDVLSTPIPEAEHMHNNSYSKLIELCSSDEGYKKFWDSVAKRKLVWFKQFKDVYQFDLPKGNISWFLDGEINASVNCLDRHAEEYGDRIALIWEKDEPKQHEFYTYRKLLELVCQTANLLLANGVKRGDTVVIYMAPGPMIVASMLACARIGAIHSIVFAGFSADALASRIIDAQARIILTADQGVRGGRIIELKRTVDQAVAKCPPDLIRAVLVHQRTGSSSVPMGKRDIYMEKELSKCSTECTPASMGSEDPLFILYTSGSTGKPKGVVHSTAGYLLYSAFTHEQVFDFRPSSDRFGCVADVGWITGHTYAVYGPLCNGGTTLLYESTPIYPDPGRYWEMVERLRLSHIYLAPTALRLLLKHGDEWVTKYDRSSLRQLGCVGEPLNHEAWEWYHQIVGEGRCDIVDTWWQTETGGILISPRPSALGAPIEPGMPMRPLPGITPVLIDLESGQPIPAGEAGYGSLCMTRPWPGIARTLWGDHKRYVENYFARYPGLYFSGDGAHRYADGSYQITGRIDDVINTSGHRLGTAEIEDALDKHPMVAESAAVGFPHGIKGEAVYAFVTLKDKAGMVKHKALMAELNALVKDVVAPYAVPDMMQITLGLPKTRSGKIMRRVLRKIAANQIDDLGDTSTLADPSVVDALVYNHKLILESKKK